MDFVRSLQQGRKSKEKNSSSRSRPRLRRSNAEKNIDYDAADSPIPYQSSSMEVSSSPSISLSPSVYFISQNSFRINGEMDEQVSNLFKSMGVSSPDDFAITPEDQEAAGLISTPVAVIEQKIDQEEQKLDTDNSFVGRSNPSPWANPKSEKKIDLEERKLDTGNSFIGRSNHRPWTNHIPEKKIDQEPKFGTDNYLVGISNLSRRANPYPEKMMGHEEHKLDSDNSFIGRSHPSPLTAPRPEKKMDQVDYKLGTDNSLIGRSSLSRRTNLKPKTKMDQEEHKLDTDNSFVGRSNPSPWIIPESEKKMDQEEHKLIQGPRPPKLDLLDASGPPYDVGNRRNIYSSDSEKDHVDETENSDDEEYETEKSDDEDEEKIQEGRDGGTDFSGSCSASTSTMGDSPSGLVDGKYFISSDGKLKRNMIFWTKGMRRGSGSFGTVYEGMSDNGFFFAVKEVSLLDQGANAQQCIFQLEQEIALLSQFEHENIVEYYGTDKAESNLYIFLELVTQGSLVNLYHNYKLGDSQVSNFTRQILRGLEYLHERGIVHRDIKCANILVNASGSVKLADFGLAKQTSKINDLKSCKGSVYWMAPEVVKPKSPYGAPADIWSLGCTVLEMLTGQVPYPNQEWVQVFFHVGQGGKPEIPASLSREARDFIQQCVQSKPEDRPTASALLQHPFVTKSPATPYNSDSSSHGRSRRSRRPSMA